MKLFADAAAGHGVRTPFVQDLASFGRISKGLALAAKAAREPALYLERKRIERRNAWLFEHTSPHIRRDVGFDPEMRLGGSRRTEC